MSDFGTTARTALHWLTAVITLVAGLPTWQCACAGAPDDSRSPVTAQSSCCCGGSCCKPASPAQRAARSHDTTSPRRFENTPCCPRHDRGFADSPDDTRGLPGKDCTTALVRSEVYLPEAGVTAVGPDDSLGGLPPAELPVVCPTAPQLLRANWQTHPAAPSPSLITLLQRFLI
jgi:hypothetical protein